MRLWHQDLIPILSDQRLLGLHREVCALRGKGWGKKHSTVDYVFTHPYTNLFLYHKLVMDELAKRGFIVNYDWYFLQYRGKTIGYDETSFTMESHDMTTDTIYKEHDTEYGNACMKLLVDRGDFALKRTGLLDKSCGAGE